jgi:hypothetical protein
VFFNRLGEIRDRSFEQQRYRASGLNLVTAAIVLWNTVYLERATAALQAHGQEVDTALLRYLSPLGWEHINLTGITSGVPAPRSAQANLGRYSRTLGLNGFYIPFSTATLGRRQNSRLRLRLHACGINSRETASLICWMEIASRKTARTS